MSVFGSFYFFLPLSVCLPLSGSRPLHVAPCPCLLFCPWVLLSPPSSRRPWERSSWRQRFHPDPGGYNPGQDLRCPDPEPSRRNSQIPLCVCACVCVRERDKWCHLPSTFCIRKINTHLKENSTLSEELIASRDAMGLCRVLFAIVELFQSLRASIQKEEWYVPIKISGTFN